MDIRHYDLPDFGHPFLGVPREMFEEFGERYGLEDEVEAFPTEHSWQFRLLLRKIGTAWVEEGNQNIATIQLVVPKVLDDKIFCTSLRLLPQHAPTDGREEYSYIRVETVKAPATNHEKPALKTFLRFGGPSMDSKGRLWQVVREIADGFIGRTLRYGTTPKDDIHSSAGDLRSLHLVKDDE